MAITYVFLLSSLGLVITQAKDCSRPVPGPNMDLKGNDINLDTFPSGTTVSFACNVGYTSKGGSPSITCTDGSWSAVKLECERKNCGALQEVTNGQIDYPDGTQFGDKAVLTCNPGYIAVGGSSIIICEDRGWSGRLPVCEVVTCAPPPAIENGDYSPKQDGYSYREVVMYSCQAGYTLSGSRSRACSEDGSFKPEAPTCYAQDCSRPVPGPNMDLKGNDINLDTFPSGTTVSFACNVGYTSKGGSPSITCTDGSWSALKLECERKNCGALQEVTNGQIDYPDGTQFGDKAVLTCNPGYIAVGGSSIIICEDRGWSGRLPDCEVVACAPPPAIENGDYSPKQDMYSYREVVMYSCKTGATLSGSRSRACSEDGSFKPEAPTCYAQDCSRPVPGPNMDLDTFPSGTTVSFACNVGYTSKGGSPSITCTDGSWSALKLECERKNCGALQEVTNGQIDYPDGTQFGDKAVLTCNPGYIAVGGSSNIICEDGRWSGRLPDCEVVTCAPPPAIENGDYHEIKEVYSYREVVMYSCQAGYTLSGSRSRTCSEDGSFKPEAPTCYGRSEGLIT